ncbi:ATP-binding protein [Streptomyces sp. LD120]|uniref:ATP-binding protein n=1 Tax=Streptomyces physcomitrii TaxID=2724184 RepID=A0ABX1H5C5_9ACTN|nr:ATP-binding protein [Streptomyces physcomitrii]
MSFPSLESRVADARRLAEAYLRLWDLSPFVDEVVLVVSELVTNAVRYGNGRPVVLRVYVSDGALVIEVRDGSPLPARLRLVDEEAESGRGLFLVAALAREWGVSPDGTTTWCALELPMQGEEA